MRLTVTGFGPFGVVRDNPSLALALRLRDDPPCGWALAIRPLEVTYSAALGAVEEIVANPPDVLVELGVHGGDAVMRLELFGRRNVSDAPDNDGVVGSVSMFPPAADVLPSTLFPPGLAGQIGRSSLIESESAGAYLCNFWYYTTLALLPGVRCGFVHVPNSEFSRPDGAHMPLADQEELLRAILDEVRKGR